MKTIACKDMGMEDDWMGKGETMEDLVKQAKEHLMAEHPDKWEEMKNMSEQEMIDMMGPHVKEV